MKLIRVGAGVLNQVPLDWAGNRARIVAAIDEARRREIALLCLPELCITGYGCEDAFFAADVQRRSLEVLADIAPSTQGLAVSVGLPIFFAHSVFNVAAFVVDGRVRGFVAKQYLAGDGVHYEPRWFKPWEAGVVTSFTWAGQSYPLGDLTFDCMGVRVGFEICEDAWVAARPGAQLSRRGVDVIFNPSASHFAFGKHEVRERIVVEASRSIGVTYVYANMLGNEAGRIIYDGDALIACGGMLLARGRRFSFADFQITEALADIELTRLARARCASFSPQLQRDEGCVEVALPIPTLSWQRPTQDVPAWVAGPWVKEEEFTRAVALGLFDYIRKSHAKGFVLSLSGGCDSGVVACLVYYMIALALQELGPVEFVRRWSSVEPPKAVADPKAWTAGVLTTVYQATRNSSKVTREAANAVASAIGATHHEIEIDSLVRGYVDLAAQALGRPLTWESDDVALQNIQARVRGPSVWMVANVRQALLLVTSNRSEAAVGYTTMDGDTCGSLSPIAGVDKAFLRTYLSWIETQGPAGLTPLPAVHAITVQAPTAELRPAEHHQTDEADLMPYDILDVIERLAIRDKQAPMAVFEHLRARFAKRDTAELVTYIERFFRLWCRNQWKRERYAPSFHLDDENLDPKTWCRFPILSAGFEVELAELRRQILGAS